MRDVHTPSLTTADNARDLLPQMRRGTLSVAERRALELHEAGLGYGRIARELGVTKATVQGAIARARRKLREPAQLEGR